MPIATSALIAGGIAAGVSAAASGTATGIAARKRKKAEKKQRKILEQMDRDNEANFLRDYYQDAFDDPSSKSYLKRISENLYDRNKAEENTAVATGATHENIQANKQAANEVMSDAVNNVVVNHETKKRAAKDDYMQRKDAIAAGNMNLAQQVGERQAQTWEGVGNIVANTANTMGQMFSASPGKVKVGGPDASAAAAGMKNVTNNSTNWIDRRSNTAWSR